MDTVVYYYESFISDDAFVMKSSMWIKKKMIFVAMVV